MSNFTSPKKAKNFSATKDTKTKIVDRIGKSDKLGYGQRLLVTHLSKFYCKTDQIDKILPILEGRSVISLRLIDWFVTNYSKKYNVRYSLDEYRKKNINLKNQSLIKKSKFSIKKKKTRKLTEKDIEILNSDSSDLSNSHSDRSSSTSSLEEINTEESENFKTETKTETKTDLEKEQSLPDQSLKLTKNQILNSFNDLFFVYSSYRHELKSYSKKSFDVFRRDGSFDFFYDEGKSVETNEGQLNFFKWALENYILEYISIHLEEIEEDMNYRIEKINGKTQKRSMEKLKAHTVACHKDKDNDYLSNKQRKKRTELSESALRKVHRINSPSIVSFK